jgi:hypothetical protein
MYYRPVIFESNHKMLFNILFWGGKIWGCCLSSSIPSFHNIFFILQQYVISRHNGRDLESPSAAAPPPPPTFLLPP